MKSISTYYHLLSTACSSLMKPTNQNTTTTTAYHYLALYLALSIGDQTQDPVDCPVHPEGKKEKNLGKTV